MTNKKMPSYGLIFSIMLITSSPIKAANFDSLNHSDNNFDIEQTLPSDNTSDNTSGGASILNSLQQSEVDNKKDHYFAVFNLLKANKINEAQDKITELLKQSPNEPQFYNLQALLDTFKKDIPGAEQHYQKALSLDKNNLAAHLGLGKLAIDAGDLPNAKAHADNILAINDRFIGAYLVLADVAYKQKNFAEVERTLQKGYEKTKGDINQEIQMLNMLAKFYISQKQPDKLLPLAEDLVKRHDNTNSALALLANVQLVNNKNELAAQTLTQLINKDPSDVQHRLLLVKIMSNNPNKEQEILQLLDETAKIDTNNPQAHIYKAAYLIKLKRSQEALAIAEQLEKQFPKLMASKIIKGDAYLADKQLDKALENYKLVYNAQPNNTVLFTIADIMQSQNKKSEAIALLDAESVKDNKNTAIHFKLATLYQLQNNLGQAQLHYEAILNQQADNALALNNLAWLYSQQNNAKSLELAKKAYALAPDSAAITDTYGYILVKQGLAKEALPILEKATTAAPKDNDIQFHLAEAHAANNNKEKAVEILETIVKSELAFSEKNQAENLLKKLKTD